MKATYTPTRSFPRHPQALQPRLPSQEDLTDVLGVVLALLLVVAAIWAIFPERSSAAPVTPGAKLELVFSGVVSGTANLGPAELQSVQCSPAGFRLASTQASASPLTLAFSAPAAATDSSFYTLGSTSALALKVDGAAYTLLSGTVTTSPGAYTFNASFVDAQSQPLQVSGRLSCP